MQKKHNMFKDFNLRWWWYGLVEDLCLARENELHALEESKLRNAQGFIVIGTDLPPGWRWLSQDALLEGSKDLIICDSYKCLCDSPEHKAIRSRYKAKIFQRRLGFFQPVILTLGGLLGIVSFIMQFVK